MRAALESSRHAALIPFSPDVPNVARIYDFFLGGKDHLQADRAAALAVLRRFPEVAGIARANRAVLADPGLAPVIDLARPVCILLVSVLHFLAAGEADLAVAAYRQAMAPGSLLVISAGTCTGTDPKLIESLHDAYSDTTPVTSRTQAEIAAWFQGLALAPPGLTDIRNWQPDSPGDTIRQPPSRARFLAGVACKAAGLRPVQP